MFNVTLNPCGLFVLPLSHRKLPELYPTVRMPPVHTHCVNSVLFGVVVLILLFAHVGSTVVVGAIVVVDVVEEVVVGIVVVWDELEDDVVDDEVDELDEDAELDSVEDVDGEDELEVDELVVTEDEVLAAVVLSTVVDVF